MIAARRAAVAEGTGFKNLDLEVEINSLGHPEQEIGEKRTRRSATDDADARTIQQCKFTFLLGRQSGECLVRAEVITVLSFLPGGTVGGSEVNSYSEAGGDCSQLELPCAIELTVTGARCTGCYDCTVETGVPGGRSLEGRVAMGPLASGVASP